MFSFDDILGMVDSANKEFYGEYTENQRIRIEEWNKMLGVKDALSQTIFKDAYFLNEFLEKIPEEEQDKFVYNTYLKYMGEECNPKYVFVSRRAVPPIEPKPESFWTTEHKEAVAGLRNELPIGSAQRLHSHILVTTLEKLIEHGLTSTEHGGSDGEISIDPTKPFSDIMFIYKSDYELLDLEEYLENGGLTQKEVLEELKQNAEERLEKQGFKM